MENKNIVPSIIIEIEVSIKLLEYLKRKSVIDDEMYNFCINKLLKKLEKSKYTKNYDVLFNYNCFIVI